MTFFTQIKLHLCKSVFKGDGAHSSCSPHFTALGGPYLLLFSILMIKLLLFYNTSALRVLIQVDWIRLD